MGCDVFGILLAADKVKAHKARHDREEERKDALTRSVREILDRLPGTHPEG